MTPARLAALGVSLVVLFAAIWLVFIGFPATGTPPPPTSVANVPSAGASSGQPGDSGEPGSTLAPGESPRRQPLPTTPPVPLQ